MANCTRTNLSCTNSDIIRSGSTFQRSTNSILIGSKDDEFHYTTKNRDMHDELIKLSKQYPEQTFTATTWVDTVYYNRIIWTVLYCDGKYKEISVKLGYVFSYPHNFNKELIEDFVNHICQYFDRIERTRLNTNGRKEFDMISHEQNTNGFSSYLTITWENEDHRFIATNKHGFMFEIDYQNKGKENLQKLRESQKLRKIENEAIKKQLNNQTNNNEYGLH